MMRKLFWIRVVVNAVALAVVYQASDTVLEAFITGMLVVLFGLTLSTISYIEGRLDK